MMIESDQKIIEQQETIDKLRAREFDGFNHFVEEELLFCSMN